jgi:hypothetical protein
MDMMMRDPKQWAHKQFDDADLGDTRRTRRLVEVAASLAAKSYGTLPRSFPLTKDLKAAYRLLANPAVEYDKILQPHLQQTYQAMCQPGQYLIIEDPTSLDFTGRQVGGKLGRIGDDRGQGIWLDTFLAVGMHGYDAQQAPQVSVLGLLAQQYWLRTGPVHRGRETDKQRLSRPRESEHWASIFPTMPPLPAEVHWIFTTDREGDVYETYVRCEQPGIDYIIRANRPRALVPPGGSTLQKVQASRVRAKFDLHLRARPGQPARTAHLRVRAIRAVLRPPYRPNSTLEPRAVGVVEVREVRPPKTIEPLHWVLLTSLPIDSVPAVLRVVQTYACRPLIEEYHKALKSGMHVEDSQLEEPQGLQALLGIHAVAAVRLLQLKHLAVQEPDRPLKPGQVDEDILAILRGQFGRPTGGWTPVTLLKSIARLGGFLARTGDGMPGWQTLWRGWQELMTLLCGYRLAKGMRCG